jgi:hypothetical protein
MILFSRTTLFTNGPIDHTSKANSFNWNYLLRILPPLLVSSSTWSLSIVLDYATLLFCSITYIYLVRVGLYRIYQIHNIVVGRIKLNIAFYACLLVQTQTHAVKRLQTLRVSLST